jgi:hypothetical protein
MRIYAFDCLCCQYVIVYKIVNTKRETQGQNRSSAATVKQLRNSKEFLN